MCSGGTMSASRSLRITSSSLARCSRRVEVDLVEHDDQRLVKGGQLDEGGVLGFVEVGIGDEQDQVGPLGGFAGHFAAGGRRRLR